MINNDHCLSKIRGRYTFGGTPKIRGRYSRKTEKKFLRIKTLFRTHISKKKYIYSRILERGGATDDMENSRTFLIWL